MHTCDGDESANFTCSNIARFQVKVDNSFWFYCDEHSDEIDEHMRVHSGPVEVEEIVPSPRPA